RVVRVGGALVFLAEDFPHREAAERGITQALLQATAAVTSLYVEAPPASDPFQELAVMTWCLACRDSLEELTLVDGTADASTRRAQALAAAMAAAAAPAALSAAAAPEAARNGTAASANNTTTGDAAAAAGVGLRQRESEGQSHGIENGENTDRDSSDSDSNGGGGGGGGGGRSGGGAAAVTAATLPSPYHTNFYRANEQASAAEEEEEEVEEQPQEWKLEHASRCRNLRQLYLENAVFDCVSTLHLCSPFASLLHLTLAKAVVAGDMVGDLLACCPQLQELTLLLCSGIGPLDLMHAPCAALKRFEVRLSNRAARKDACLELLRLNAPNLEAPSLEEFHVEYHDHAMAVIAFLTATTALYRVPFPPPTLQAPSLEEFHVEYHDHAMAVIAFLTALLRGSPRLRCIQPMVTVPQEPGTDLLGDKDFRQAIARLQAEFPRVSFPSVWQLT
ncbi:unnamed protein product, partial [Closterium sp. NIES-54]